MQRHLHVNKSFWLKKSVIYIIYFLGINALNIQSAIIGRMNVWKIFRYGFFHLKNHQDLYLFYPNEYFDSYLYSPTFPVLFAPFSLLPNYVAYFLWNNLNMLLVPFLIYKIKGISDEKKAIVCYIALIEILTCLQGTQTNVIIGCLMLLSFLSFEKKHYWVAAFAIAAGFYLKIYPLITASLFLFYAHKGKFIFKLIISLLILGLLPLFFITPTELYLQYQNWFRELTLDSTDNGDRISLTGLLHVYFNISGYGKLIVQFAGVGILFLPFLRRGLFKEYFYRYYFLCALFIWVVLFNHASEIYGYAIAILGVGLWYVHQKQNRAMTVFIILFIFFASVLSIDPTPQFISRYIYHHSLKTIPYTIILGIILFQMLSKKPSFFTRPEEKDSILNHALQGKEYFQ